MLKNRLESFAKYAGIATVSFEWLALLLYYIQLPAYFGGKYPISDFAFFPQTRLVFIIFYTLAGIFYWIFIRHHLYKLYKAPLKLFAFSMIFFVGLAITPFDPYNSLSRTIHNSLGLSSSLFFIVGMYVLAKNSHNRQVAKGTNLAIIISLTLLIIFFITPRDSHFVFAFEVGSWFVWQIWTLWISLVSYRHSLLHK